MGKGSDMNIARKREMTRAPGGGAPDLSVESTQGKVDPSIRALLLASVGSAFEFYNFVVSPFSLRRSPSCFSLQLCPIGIGN